MLVSYFEFLWWKEKSQVSIFQRSETRALDRTKMYILIRSWLQLVAEVIIAILCFFFFLILLLALAYVAFTIVVCAQIEQNQPTTKTQLMRSLFSFRLRRLRWRRKRFTPTTNGNCDTTTMFGPFWTTAHSEWHFLIRLLSDTNWMKRAVCVIRCYRITTLSHY